MKKAAKKRASPKKRPPRQLWIVFDDEKGGLYDPSATRAEAQKIVDAYYVGFDGARVAGPYVLAERVTER
jgi:hypothetical protein